MAYEVVMPRLGWNMETGALSSWRKHSGDMVQAGEILFEVESDKAIQEVEALESGILHIPSVSPESGVQVPVGTLLAYLLKPGEAFPSGSQTRLDIQTAPAAEQSVDTVTNPPRPGRELKAISPRAARIADELGVEWGSLTGSGRTGRIVERDVRRAAEQMRGEGLPAMPAFSDNRTKKQTTSVPKLTEPIVQPISTIRRLTAERMSASVHTSAPVTLTTEADASELVRLRRQLKEDGSKVLPTYTDLFICICTHALREHPALSSYFQGETIVQPATVNIGIAVDTERGLLVPVLKDAHTKTLPEVAVESVALIEKARKGHLSTEEMSGGTFSITNLGMYEIDGFTPIINLPECAVLGVGRITPKQVVVDVDANQVAIREMVFLSLTFDHRLVDGAPAARFLQRIKHLVEKPYLWLAR